MIVFDIIFIILHYYLMYFVWWSSMPCDPSKPQMSVKEADDFKLSLQNSMMDCFMEDQLLAQKYYLEEQKKIEEEQQQKQKELEELAIQKPMRLKVRSQRKY